MELNDDYCSFKTALKLDKLHFPRIQCSLYYTLYEGEIVLRTRWYNSDISLIRPTLSMVQKWLIEKKNINVWAYPIIKENNRVYRCNILFADDTFTTVSKEFVKFSEALEAGINEAIDIETYEEDEY